METPDFLDLGTALTDVSESLSLLDGEGWDPNLLFDGLDTDGRDVNFATHSSSDLQEQASTTQENSNTKRRKVVKPKSGKNKARDERQFVLIRLKEEAAQLQFTLEQLQSIQGTRSSDSNEEEIETERGVPRVWKAICCRQFARRLKTERENIRLKQEVEKEKTFLKHLEKLIYKRRMKENGVDRYTRRTDIPAGYIERMAAFIFEELSAGVETWYRQVGGELKENSPVPVAGRPLLPGGVKGVESKFFDMRNLPFSMRATSEAWWLNWHNHRGRPVQENGGDVVAESFGLEMSDFKANSSVTSYGQQILWRHLETDRNVFVWNAYMEPFAFENERISGVYFLEQYFVFIKPGEDESSACMSTCYIITPYVLSPELQDDPKICALISFFVSALCSTIKVRGEAVEDLLLDQALQTHSFG